MTDADSLDDFERVPCPDGSCIGTIGADGTCRYCGAEYEGELPWEGGASLTLVSADGDKLEDDDEDANDDDLDADNGTDDERDERLDDDEDDHWYRRELCPDGSCIGTIGEDGHCTECGRDKE